jgi:hypothetical protein
MVFRKNNNNKKMEQAKPLYQNLFYIAQDRHPRWSISIFVAAVENAAAMQNMHASEVVVLSFICEKIPASETKNA